MVDVSQLQLPTFRPANPLLSNAAGGLQQGFSPMADPAAMAAQQNPYVAPPPNVMRALGAVPPVLAPQTPPGLPVVPTSAPVRPAPAAAAPKPATGPLGFQSVSQFPPGALISGGAPSRQAAPTAPQVAAGPHRNLSPHEAQILLSAAMPRVSPQEAALSTVFNVHAGLLSKNLAKADNDYAALMQHAVTPADVAVADKFRSDQYAAHLNPFVEDMKKFGFGWLPQQLLINQGLQQNQGYPNPDGTVQ